MNYNKVILVGRLTRDPELRYTAKGNPIANFALAVSRKWTDNGEKKEETLFADCVSFGKAAEIVSQHARKGNTLLVSGRLQQQSWDDKQTGQKRHKMVVVSEEFQFLGGKPEGQASAPRAVSASDSPATSEDSDLPF